MRAPRRREHGGPAGTSHGTNSVVEVDGAASLFSGRNAWSVEAWVNHTPDGAFRYLFSAADASSVNIMKVQSSNSALYLSRDAGSGDQFAVAAPLSAGVHHVVGTYDGANLRLYVRRRPRKRRDPLRSRSPLGHEGCHREPRAHVGGCPSTARSMRLRCTTRR